MRQVERSTTIPADPEDVWAAVIRGDWLGEDVVWEPRPGGDGVVVDGSEIRHVVVERVDAGRSLVYRWWPLNADGVGEASRVTIDVEPGEEHTRVVIVEAPAVGAGLPPSSPMAMAFA